MTQRIAVPDAAIEPCGTAARRLRRTGRTTTGILTASMALAVLSAPVQAARAETLYDALRVAHAQNPTITAQRAAVRAGAQDVALSATGFAPDISVVADYGYRDREGRAPGFPRTRAISQPRSVGVGITQNLWNGFRTVSSVARDKAALWSQQDRLLETEQSILVDVATSYVDVLRDSAILEIRKNNQKLLEARNKQALYQFQVGQLTSTDVDQVAASLSKSDADVAIAKLNLDASRATFRALVGYEAGQLARTGLPMALMPRSLDAAIARAMKVNPAIRAARNSITAADYNIAVQKAGYLPSLDVSMVAEKRWDPDFFQADTQFSQTAVIGRLTVPLFDRGITPLSVQRATEVRSQKRAELDRESAFVQASVIQNWSLYTASETSIRSAQAQILANDRALDSVSLEASLGQRTTLDVLITQQALFDSRVNLEVAERDRIVAGFRLLALVSELNLEMIRPGDLRYAQAARPVMPASSARMRLPDEDALASAQGVLRSTLDADAQPPQHTACRGSSGPPYPKSWCG